MMNPAWAGNFQLCRAKPRTCGAKTDIQGFFFTSSVGHFPQMRDSIFIIQISAYFAELFNVIQ
jgi:hypothetical protein